MSFTQQQLRETHTKDYQENKTKQALRKTWKWSFPYARCVRNVFSTKEKNNQKFPSCYYYLTLY